MCQTYQYFKQCGPTNMESNCIKRFISIRPISDQPKVITPIREHFLVPLVRKKRTTTVTQLVSNHLIASITRISSTTVWRRLHNSGFCERLPTLCVPLHQYKNVPTNLDKIMSFMHQKALGFFTAQWWVQTLTRQWFKAPANLEGATHHTQPIRHCWKTRLQRWCNLDLYRNLPEWSDWPVCILRKNPVLW